MRVIRKSSLCYLIFYGVFDIALESVLLLHHSCTSLNTGECGGQVEDIDITQQFPVDEMMRQEKIVKFETSSVYLDKYKLIILYSSPS